MTNRGSINLLLVRSSREATSHANNTDSNSVQQAQIAANTAQELHAMASTLSKDYAAVQPVNGAPLSQPVDEQDVKDVVHQAMAKDISKGAAVHVRFLDSLQWRTTPSDEMC